MAMDPLPAPLTGSIPTQEERTWAMVAHLGAFAGHVFPFAHIIVPLVVWLMKKDTSAFVNVEGRESVNAQISFTLYMFAAGVLCFVLIGLPLLIALYFANVILVIVASIKTYDGVGYRYPYILRLVK